MFTQMGKRKYDLKKRAEQQEQTRQRIVEAAMELHQELGPRGTTISAVAERAGVQRLTVYRHFEDDTALFQACSSHWLELNPPPDPHDWSEISSPEERTRVALQALFRYYRKTEVMWSRVYQDLEETPALQVTMAAVAEYRLQIRKDLLKAWTPEGGQRRDVRATLDHCLQFATWQSLKEQGISDKAMVALVMRWILAVIE